MADVVSSSVTALRMLAADAVQAANSGHPGAPLGMAEMATALWANHLRHNPMNPQWANRDRFILSNGHASMLIYALLHLTGYDLSMGELRNFRQFGSKTPGHPEYKITPGVETTTGPLGQGLGNAVGMALAERLLAQTFNRPGFDIIDHFTYVFMGDGCLMEGISHEVCSLAGTLNLGKLICLYDDNSISIDGNVTGWFTENIPERFKAYGWHVISDVDGHDVQAVTDAISLAKTQLNKPTLICCKTVIGKGSPNKAGSSGVHGSPLGDEEIQKMRGNLAWSHEPFSIPEDVAKFWNAKQKGEETEKQWNTLFDAYAKQFPEIAAEFKRRFEAKLPTDWSEKTEQAFKKICEESANLATRKSSQFALQNIGPVLPELLGGSADLTGSNLTAWSGSISVTPEKAGNYIHYGVREFGMAAMQNGISIYGGFIPYSGTFLTFSDYARNALRMAALMRIRSIFVFTHDSIGVGEDGPTHQPIEHAASLRLIPNLDVWRPCDAAETFVAWLSSIERADGPSTLLLSRQNLPFLNAKDVTRAKIETGGYIIMPESDEKKLQLVLIATGSEVQIAVKARQALESAGISTRVVSMPCIEKFDRQPIEYRNKILPQDVSKIAIEAGIPDLWRKYVGFNGDVIGISTFGASAPASVLFEHFGLTANDVVVRARMLLAV